MVDLIWATRGRTWGFRFLLSGGSSNPLPPYESAFTGTETDDVVFRRTGHGVALRFPDPLQRTDSAGRIIPHDFVVPSPGSDAIDSVDDGLRVIWPIVARVYAEVWDSEAPPSIAAIRLALTGS